MVYGLGTRSFGLSTENRRMKRERAEFTKKYEAGEVKFETIEISPSCTCRSFRYPHAIEAHKKLRSEHDWRPFEKREREEVNSYQEWGSVR